MHKNRKSKELVRDEVICQLKTEKSRLEKEVKKLKLELDLLKMAFSEKNIKFNHTIH
jgi:hypothetical protein